MLPRLRADDLIALGVTSIGHRRRLLDAIAGLRAEPLPASRERAGPLMPKPAEAEPRHLTLLFHDLVGSTERGFPSWQGLGMVVQGWLKDAKALPDGLA